MLYRFRLLSQAGYTRKACYQDLAQRFEDELLRSAEAMLEDRQYNMAFRLATLFNTSSIKSRLFRSLVADRDTPDMVRAKVLTAMAEDDTLEAPPDSELSNALQILKRQHAFRSYAFEGERELTRCLQGEPINQSIINDAAQRFQQLDYRLGLHSMAMKLHKAQLAVFNYQAATNTGQELEVSAKEMGLQTLYTMDLAITLARSQLRSGFEDRTRSAAMELYNRIKDTELAHTLGHLAFLICQIQARFDNYQESQVWQSRCLEHWKQCQPEDHAQAIVLGFNIESESMHFNRRDAERDCQGLLDRVQAILNDVHGFPGHSGYQMQLLGTAATFVAKSRRSGPGYKNAALEQLQQQMEAVIEGNKAANHDSAQLASCKASRANQYLVLAMQRPDTVMEQNCETLLQEALQIYWEQSQGHLTFHLISTRQSIGICQVALFKKARRLGYVDALQYLKAAMESFQRCEEGWVAFGSPSLTAQCRYWLARIKYEEFLVHGHESFSALISSLELAEHDYDQQRIEISISSGLDAIKDKQALAKDNHVRDIYLYAIQACISVGNASQLWDWVQKSKARSLSDLLGLGATIPQRLMDSINQNEQARGLLEQELALKQQTQHEDTGQRFHASQELLRVHARMREVPALERLLNIRTGFAYSRNELRSLFADPDSGLPNEPFSMVDWVISGSEIWMLVVSAPDFAVKFRRIHSSPSIIADWRKHNLEQADSVNESLEVHLWEADQPLRQLDSLIEHVDDLTQPGELLVLCPTGLLNAIPIHALHHARFNRYRPTLLDRNPVVYASSMTNFIQCCREANRASSRVESSFTSVYEARPGTELDLDEQSAAYEQVRGYAEAFQGHAAVGLEADVPMIEETWPRSRVITFHGHCERSGDDITQQGLILGNSFFHVPSFFKLRLAQPLVLLIACGSSSQQISLGDEPLGILTALLCAGASTVLGSLWEVRSEPARRFADVFLGLLQRELECPSTPDDSDINLARLFRKAVLQVRSGQSKQLIDWGAFVLHGSWFMKRGHLGSS